MIFQSQAVDRILTESGQLNIDPSDLGLSPERVSRAIFCPSVTEYSTRYRPEVKRTFLRNSYQDDYLLQLPEDCIQVQEVKPVDFATIDVLQEALTSRHYRHLFRTLPLHGASYKMDIVSKTVLVPRGTFSITYLSNGLPTKNVMPSAIPGTNHTARSFKFDVPWELACPGFNLHTFAKHWEVSSTDDPVEVVNPDLDDPAQITSFTLENDCGYEWVCNVTFDRPVSHLRWSGIAALPVAPTLTYEEDSLFFLMFLVKYGHAYANAKKQMAFQDAVFDFNQDDFLSWVRQKEEAYQRALESEQAWWLGIG